VAAGDEWGGEGGGEGRGGADSGRQAYSRLTDDKRVIYYRQLPAGTAAPPAPLPPPSLPTPPFPSSLVAALPPSLPPSASLPVPREPSFPPVLALAPASRPSVAALQITPLSLAAPATPASFIRRKIHLHNGPHAHYGLLTRSIGIVCTPSWKLTNWTYAWSHHLRNIRKYGTLSCISRPSRESSALRSARFSWISQRQNAAEARVSRHRERYTTLTFVRCRS